VAADANCLSWIAAVLAEHMTLLHRDFGHGDRIAAREAARIGRDAIDEHEVGADKLDERDIAVARGIEREFKGFAPPPGCASGG
jgi:hypothetical protein